MQSDHPPFKFSEITESFVHTQLEKLDSRKATGVDNISARLLKDASHIMAKPLTKLMNASLKTGTIPLDWKKARVSPIFKAGDPEEASNYRPISILPICMKVFERAVHTQLYAFIKEHNIMCTNQSGFRPQHSTATALLEVTDGIISNMDRGLLTGAVYLDLKKAFDTVDHATLLKKLSHMGIRDVELKWFEDYLSNRSQCVKVDNCTSEFLEITYGVP